MDSWAARAAAWWSQQVWQPRASRLALALAPLSALYGALAQSRATRTQPTSLPVPVVVVGNWVVGGAGKTPTVIALVQALAERGFTPGVVSRGFGRAGDGIAAVDAASTANAVGDEPLLIHRRTGVPVFVGRDRPAAALVLCAQHPRVDVIVSDDGLQHHALPRAAEIWVFDDRGIGNGRLLPAGPLRAPLPQTVPAMARVLYTGDQQSTALPGALATRALRRAVALDRWWLGDDRVGQPLGSLCGRAVLAVAGIATPEKFFSMLVAAGLSIRRAPQPDHADYTRLPWPSDTSEVVLTEKDAVKIAPNRIGSTRVWVVPLDFALPQTLAGDIAALLHRPAATHTP